MTSVTPSLPLEYSDQRTRRSREAAGAACGAGERHRRDRDVADERGLRGGQEAMLDLRVGHLAMKVGLAEFISIIYKFPKFIRRSSSQQSATPDAAGDF
ncbi:hypothetical protein BS78_06G012200 [Paspalum vaginatum]|nr:hypothetical protein BS78_06G012200 [Paspalum vaginatum]